MTTNTWLECVAYLTAAYPKESISEEQLSLYAPLLMGPVYTHGPWDRLGLWTADQEGVKSIVLRIKDDPSSAQRLKAVLAPLVASLDHDPTQKQGGTES